MSERDQPDVLTPAQSEAVRRLLASARHDEGIPDDVAARLDTVIADLTVEGADQATAPVTPDAREATVVPLRRRRWPQVLVAAAAVTLIGYGTAQIVTGDGAGQSDSGGSALEATSDRAGDEAAAPEGDSEGAAPQPASSPSTDALDGALLRLDENTLTRLGVNGLTRLRPGAFESDLKALAESRAALETTDTKYAAGRSGLLCGPFYEVIRGETFAASFRRHFALVVFHPVLDGARLVEIYDCQSATPRRTVRTVTLQTGE